MDYLLMEPIQDIDIVMSFILFNSNNPRAKRRRCYIFNDTDNNKPVIYKLGLSGGAISFYTQYVYTPDISEKFGIQLQVHGVGLLTEMERGQGIVVEKSTRPGTISDPNPKIRDL
ncbi:MAG: hypothetical protein R2806_11495 [Saprospiraceae bacterium]